MIELPWLRKVGMNLTQYTCCTPLKKNFVLLHPHLLITATFFRPQGDSCGEVQLHKILSSEWYIIIFVLKYSESYF